MLEVNQIDTFAARKSVGFWKKQGLSLIAITLGLLLARIVGIKGSAVIAIFLMTVGVKRKANAHQKSRTKKNLLHYKKVAYSVVHAIPGRVRFNVPLIVRDSKYAQQLEDLLTADKQLSSFRVNRDAASVVITYKPNVISDSRMRSHLASVIQSARNTPVKTNLTTASIILACSLEVRQTTVSSDSCCLLKSKSGKPLKGGALAARSHRLCRIGVLLS
ncbi:hypothetical protein NUACC21_40210 [Scytonema sp. NUACC21]